jgi:HK97 family phage major capsid protein
MELKEIQARQIEIAELMAAISKVAEEEARELTEEDNDQILALDEEFSSLSDQVKEIEAKNEAKAIRDEKIQKALAKVVEAKNVITPASGVQPLTEEIEPVKIPAKALSHKSKIFASNEDAFVAGSYLASIAGHKPSQEFMAAQSVGTDSEGGYTVPSPLAAELINLVEEYGVVRGACRNVSMGATTWDIPKLTGHSTVYYPAENAAISESQLTFDQVQLVAQKMAGLVKMSTEIAEDSLISMTDTIVRDLAWGFAKEEDDNLFTGGTLYTGGIQGDAAVADTNVASVAALTLENLTAVVVASGQERGLRPEWYMNPTLYHGKVRDLLNAAGGNTIGDIQAGQKPTLFGYPVNLVNAMPGAAAATSGDLIAVFGDLGVSHYFGSRRSLEFRVLRELFAVNDQVGVVCTQRVALKSVNPEVASKLTLT